MGNTTKSIITSNTTANFVSPLSYELKGEIEIALLNNIMRLSILYQQWCRMIHENMRNFIVICILLHTTILNLYIMSMYNKWKYID